MGSNYSKKLNIHSIDKMKLKKTRINVVLGRITDNFTLTDFKLYIANINFVAIISVRFDFWKKIIIYISQKVIYIFLFSNIF